VESSELNKVELGVSASATSQDFAVQVGAPAQEGKKKSSEMGEALLRNDEKRDGLGFRSSPKPS
jgi:hypothetical protein